jgi:hypothetical protein
MGTFNEELLAQLRVELASQNEQWRSTMRALSRLGEVRVVVRREFFEQLDALARSGVVEPQGLRA